MLRRAGDGEREAAPCTRGQELGGERVDRGARRHDVVDDRDALPAQVAAHRKDPCHARTPLPRALTRLRNARDAPHDAALEQRQTELVRERPADLARLVVAALATASAVQRHGHERVDVAATRRQRRREQQRERAAERPHAAVFQRVHVVLERRAIVKRRNHGRDGPTRAAQGAARGGRREPAARTRAAHAREHLRANGTEALARGPAAGGAALDEQRISRKPRRAPEVDSALERF